MLHSPFIPAYLPVPPTILLLPFPPVPFFISPTFLLFSVKYLSFELVAEVIVS